MANIRIRAARLLVSGAAVALTAGLIAVTPAAAQATEHGSEMFRTYCSACHGPLGRGDGALASSMLRKPSDLTAIAKREGGTFPTDKVFKIIDGREEVKGHGGPDMPVWGNVLKRSMVGGDDANVKTRIEQLVKYLESIQTKPAGQ